MTKLSFFLAAPALALTLTGCASVAGPHQQLQPKRPVDIFAEAIGSSPLNGIVSSEENSSSAVIVSSEYISASGKVCRRFGAVDGDHDVRVACQEQSGQWYIQRSLVPAAQFKRSRSTSTEPTSTNLQEPTSIVPVLGQATEAPSEHTVAAGESLWLFSKRVTGKGSHWRQIAKINAITDVDSIVAGVSLSVPDSLVVN